MARLQSSGETRSIARLSQKAVTSLSALSAEPAPGAEAPFTIDGEIERYDIWRAQHDVDDGKLDRLKETSVLRARVISLLDDLCDLHLDKAQDSEHLDDPGHRATDTLPLPRLEHLRIREHGDGQSDLAPTSSSVDTNVSFPDSLPETPVTRAHEIITLLLDLAPALEDPTSYGRHSHFIFPNAEKYDVDHAKAKFPKADDQLVQQLGKANWERRQYFSALRADHEIGPARKGSLEKEDRPLADEPIFDIDPAQYGQTPSSDLATEGDSSPESSEDESGEVSSTADSHGLTDATTAVSDFNFSHVTTRSTVRTEHNFQSMVDPDDAKPSTKYVIPEPPEPSRESLSNGFVCPYCFRFLTNIKSAKAWRSHVFEDIQPYVCTYPDCSLVGKTYGNKKTWWEHERDRHRVTRYWMCRPCESRQRESNFRTTVSFDKHLDEQHSISLTDSQKCNIRSLCRREGQVSPPPIQCPLCKETIVVRRNVSARVKERKIRDHISDHLEQLAFFVAFPAGEMVSNDDDSQFQDDSDSDDGGFKSEIKSIASKDTHMSRKDVQLTNIRRFMANREDFHGDFLDGSRARELASDDKHTGGSEGRAQLSRSPKDPHHEPPVFPIKIITHPPNEHFYARQPLIEETERLLKDPGSICLFYGVGGVGKTLAAVEYVYTHEADFDAIFWLQADTAPGRSDSYHQMALALKLISGFEGYNQIMDKGREWLENTKRRWLLVFDNAIQWKNIAEFLPNALRRTNGSVLITTQNRDFLGSSDNVTILKLDQLPQKAGSDMLLRYLGRDEETDTERRLAEEISVFVGGLPVAIAHVAGYLGYSEYSLEEMIETFRQWRRRTGTATSEEDDLPISFRKASFSYDETLAMVWSVTLRELSKDSSDVMNVLAYLNGEAIPETMLWRVHEDPNLHFPDKRESNRIKRIKNSLIRRRLVQVKEMDGESCFSIHRSLQRGIREGLLADPSKQQIVFDQAVALIREVFPRSNAFQQPTPDQWAEWQRLLPHLHSLRDVYYKAYPQIQGSIDFAQLLTDAGMDQFECGDTKQGLLLLKTAEKVLDTGSPDDAQVIRSDIHAMIAIMYDNTGITNRREALERRKIALSTRTKIFNEAKQPTRKDQTLLYNSEMEYAISLLHYHRYRDAEPIIEKCLKYYQQWDTEAKIPFEYAKYYNKIALVRMYQGRFDEAIKLGFRGISLMERTGFTLFESRFKFDVGCIILQSGDLKRALKVHKEILAQRREKLGQTNELTLHSIYAIGAIYELQGNFDEAHRYFSQALGQRRNLTSWPEEAYARAQFHMSRVLVARGRSDDAETAQTLYEKAVKVLYRLLPLDHPPELKDVQDEAVLFDHMLPISPGGTRFTGRDLLPYFMRKK